MVIIAGAKNPKFHIYTKAVILKAEIVLLLEEARASKREKPVFENKVCCLCRSR